MKTHKTVQKLAKYSVEQYNMKFKEGEKGSLTLKEVVEAQTQVVAGTRYTLNISAIEDGICKLFKAVVTVQSWKNPSTVVSIFPSSNQTKNYI